MSAEIRESWWGAVALSAIMVSSVGWVCGTLAGWTIAGVLVFGGDVLLGIGMGALTLGFMLGFAFGALSFLDYVGDKEIAARSSR